MERLPAQPRFARRSAILGAIAWTTLCFIRTSPSAETELINKILLLGILVIVPLGLSLVATPDRNGRHSLPYRLAVFLQPFAAIAGVISFFIEQGPQAAALAFPWVAVTGLIALFGLWRFLPRGFRYAEEVSIDAGLIFVTIGGASFILSRLGAQPLGFGDTIVLLTAVHFHFAGFAAPILVGLAGRVIGPDGPARRLLQSAVICLITGIPLVAVGITLSPPLALVGAALIFLALLLLAVAVLGWVLPSLRSLTAQVLLVVSSFSSASAMVLATAYAYSIVTKTVIVDIPQMAMTHGIMNSVGFALGGLIAWSIIRPDSRAAIPGVPFSKFSGGRFAGPDYFQRVGAVSLMKPAARGLVDRFSIYGRADFDPESVSDVVRSFYEKTIGYRLVVRPFWQTGFRFGGRLAHRLGTMCGQMRMPVVAESMEDHIESKLFSLDDSLDGRTGVRAWVRTYQGTDEAMYVAAYATHSMQGNTYMNIAFPILGGNVASILHLSSIAQPRGSLALSTLPSARLGGDQGVYFANRFIPVRLPINEVITVWAVDNAADREADQARFTVKARHEMWLWGIKFLELEYDIFPLETTR